MSSFNQFFKSPSGAAYIVGRIFKNVDKYSEKKITSLKHKIEDEEHPASYYVENEQTASFKVRVMYQLDNKPEILETEFEVPKEIDGAFILEGKYRVANNRLDNDRYNCRINMSGTSEHSIQFDYFRKYLINEQILKVKKRDEETGLMRREINFKLSDFDKAMEQPDKKELFKLTEEQSQKLQIKLDLDYKPEYINEKLINDCLAFGDDRLKDLIVDKTIKTISKRFTDFLFSGRTGNVLKVQKGISTHLAKYGVLPTPVNSLTYMCTKFFKGSTNDSKENDIQVSSGINSMNIQSLMSKVTIPDTVAYNTTMTDIVDLADTPINGNVNLQNSLTVSTHVTEDGILFDVYTKDFKKVTIKYNDYLNSKVVSSEYVDYDTKTVKPNEQGEIEVKHRMKRKMVKADDYDLIDLHPDYRLSTTTRRIPFVNYTDSVRISMGTSMLKQSIPLANAERALVDSGNTDDLAENTLNERFKHAQGVVKEITPDKVIISVSPRKKVEIPRRSSIKSVNDVTVFTEPKVKVGQVVKEGDVITGAVGHEKDTYKAGVNTLVLFHAYFGKINEDALVISESYAKRIMSYSIIDVPITIKTAAAIKWIAPIGTRVKSKDPIMSVLKAIRLDAVNKKITESIGGIFGSNGEEINLEDYSYEDFLKVPNNIDDAVVADVMIQKNEKPKIPGSAPKPDYSFAHTSDAVIKEYEKTKVKARKVIYDKFPEYVASDTLKPVTIDPADYKMVYTVRIRLIKYTYGMIGTKITSRYGGKGVVSEVVPDELMPYMIDSHTKEKKRVEVVMNPYSTINRKIPSVIMEQGLGLIAHNLHDRVDMMKDKPGQKEKILPLLEKYYPGRFSSMSTDEFIKYHNNNKLEDVYYFAVGSYSTKFTPALITKWMEELKVSSQSDIYMPEEHITDWQELENHLTPEELEKIKDKKKGRFVKVDKPLMCGYMTLETLYHIPSYSNKVTSGMYYVDGVNPKRDEPIMGRGRYRVEGQKIGEMELNVLLARNAKSYISKAREPFDKETNQLFLNNLLGLGMTITDDKGYNQGGSSAKENVEKIKNKFRFKLK